MPPVVPPRFLFRYTMPVRYRARLPLGGRKLLNLPQECALPDFSGLDAAETFGHLRAAWNTSGLGFSVAVGDKTTPLDCRISEPTESDGLQLWIDTRNTQSIHRASRYCHSFCVLPTGSGRGKKHPIAIPQAIARARDESRLPDSKRIRAQAEVTRDGYRLEVWFPSTVLTGFDPEANPLLGFTYCLRDAQLGEQNLTVGRDFPFAHDPSLWSTLELTR